MMQEYFIEALVASAGSLCEYGDRCKELLYTVFQQIVR
jgi:hypothetical protein